MQPIITITFSLKITSHIIKRRHTLNLHRFFLIITVCPWYWPTP